MPPPIPFRVTMDERKVQPFQDALRVKLLSSHIGVVVNVESNVNELGRLVALPHVSPHADPSPNFQHHKYEWGYIT